MDSVMVGFLGIAILLVMMALGFQIAVCMGVSGIIGFTMLVGFKAGLHLAATQAFSVCSNYSYTVIPLFMLMGLIIYSSGLARDVYDAMERWVGRLRGGLMMATTAAAAVFGAANGSSIAASVTFTKISIPEMIRLGYHRGLACGSIAAAGTLSAIIPPSALLVIYAILTEQSIGKCLMAGIIPGLLTTVAYMLLIWFIAIVKPEMIPRGQSHTIGEKLTSLKSVWPLPLIGFVVLFGLYTGIFTPTEASAIGAFMAIMIPMVYKSKRSNISQILKESAAGTLGSSVMIFTILIGAFIFSSFLAVSRVPLVLAELAINSGLSRIFILLLILVMFFIMGTFMSATAMLVVTMPIVFPIITTLGYDPIWFAIISVKMAEFGVMTPPVGLNVYAVKGAAPAEVRLEEIFKGVFPFIGVEVLVMAILIAFPEIVLLIPNAMN